MIREEEILAALRTVIDPELGINIVDLGLVYDVVIDGDRVHVDLTMTSPACPLHAYVTDLATKAIREHVAGVAAVEIALVWEPEWEPSMISDAAKRILGW